MTRRARNGSDTAYSITPHLHRRYNSAELIGRAEIDEQFESRGLLEEKIGEFFLLTRILLEKTAKHSHLHPIATLAFSLLRGHAKV
jgi:hypothetical protein